MGKETKSLRSMSKLFGNETLREIVLDEIANGI